MSRKVFFTFRSFPFKNEIGELFGEAFVFGKLREDFDRFTKLIGKDTDYIIGIALSHSKSSLEPVAVNEFSGGKKIDRKGPQQIKLFVPPGNVFKTAAEPTTSFCNWTMFKIGNFLLKNRLKSKFIFLHITARDFPKLKDLQIL